jgi:hypothetical protein
MLEADTICQPEDGSAGNLYLHLPRFRSRRRRPVDSRRSTTLRWWAVQQESPGFSPLDEEIIKVSIEGAATHRMKAGEVRASGPQHRAGSNQPRFLREYRRRESRT